MSFILRYERILRVPMDDLSDLTNYRGQCGQTIRLVYM